MRFPVDIGMADPRNPHDVLLHRAKRLVSFLELTATPKQIIAEEIFLIFKAGVAHCGRCLGISFWKWMSDANNYMSICGDCSSAQNPAGKCNSCRGSLPIH